MKNRIIKAYKDLAESKGLYHVTVNELAAQAGISKRTLYKYFSSKDAIIEAMLEQLMQEVSEGFERILAEEDHLEDVLTHMIKHLAITAYPVINPLVMKDLHEHYPELWQKIDDFRTGKIKKFIAALTDRFKIKNIDRRILTVSFTASVQAVLNPEFITRHNLNFDNTAKQLVELFAYGFLKK